MHSGTTRKISTVAALMLLCCNVIFATGCEISNKKDNKNNLLLGLLFLYGDMGITAKRVYGQGGVFTTDAINYGGSSRNCLKNPNGVAVDSTGVYIADTYNNRVLYYSGTSTTATRVYGQDNFTSNSANKGGSVSATTLYRPSGVAVSSTGVYIADTYNNRVLYYSGTSTTATRVYGQDNFTSNSANKGGSVSATTLYQPTSIAVSSTDVYIADNYNHRVLYYSGTSTTATRVYGQGGSFTTANQNNGGISADSLNWPRSVAVSSTSVYVADMYNCRVLYYSGISTTATRVYGQPNYTSSGSGTPSETTLDLPMGVTVDSTGVNIADANNHRVLYYPGTSTTATRVYGQGGSFTANTANNGGISSTTLYIPVGFAVDSTGLYVVDGNNQRVLYYPGTSTTATRVYGQGGEFNTNKQNKGGIDVDANANGLYGSMAMAVDSTGVYIADTLNHRVLYYSGISTTATRVYGQGDDFAALAANNGGVSANSLYYPTSVTVDTNGIYIADSFNHRVLYYEGASTTATRVYGQGDYASNSANRGGSVSGNSLYMPTAIAVDSTGVYIADYGNNRVLYFSGATTMVTRVYGQGGSYTTNIVNKGGISANSLYNPSGMAADSSGLYIADQANNRVLFYPGAAITATRVYGQGGSFTANTANNGGISADSLNSPKGIAVDTTGLYIADQANNRVLFYPGAAITATRVYGQAGSLIANVANNGGISPKCLESPNGVGLYSTGVYIVDSGNNRVLFY